MPISKNHHDLFHSSSTLDKINLFQSLLDSQDITSMEALALLNTIHMELGQPQEHAPEVYERYAQMMEALRRKNPNVHEEVLRKWSDLQSILKARESKKENFPEDLEADAKDGKKRQIGYEAPQQKVVGGLPQKPTRHVAEDSDVEQEEEAGGEETEEEAEEEESEEKESEKEETEKEEKEEDAEEENEEKEKEESKEEDAEEENEKEESDEKEKEEDDEEVEEEKEEETEKEETEAEEESEEGEHEEKEEAEEEAEKGEEEEKTEHEVAHEEPAEEADHMAGEAAEAQEEAEHEEMHESESSTEVEETDLNIGAEEEPPMEPEG